MGATVSGWWEGVLLSLAFLTCLTIIVVGMNGDYSQNNVISLNDSSSSSNLFVQYQDTAKSQVQGGEVDFNAQQGITLKSSYGLIKDAITIIWKFLTGGWIEQVISLLNLGDAGTVLAFYLRILYFLSLISALLYALFKVMT